MDLFAAGCVGLHRNKRQLSLFRSPCQPPKSLIFASKQVMMISSQIVGMQA
jgi:hypothetical protein